MKLQTHIPLEKRTENCINYQSKVLLLGSCFVENIGSKLEHFKFQNSRNPFGVLFHPKAIETLVLRALHEKPYTDEDVFFNNEQWHCFDAHSQLSNSSKDILLENLNYQCNLLRQNLLAASHIIITLGTAWVYRHNTSNMTVANCHKVAQKDFNKELLSIKEVTDALGNLKDKIKEVNPKATFIFTVSPIRHIKDGFVENMRSKAHLIAAVHTVLSSISNSRDVYFPSYEIMMDELRDYRFYAEDMLHPNATAINYIWEKFQKVWMTEDTLKIMDEVDHIQNGMAHRPFNPNSEAHTKFLKQLELKKQTLKSRFEHIVF